MVEEVKNENIIQIEDKISPFLPPTFMDEVIADNDVHFYEKSLATKEFSNFFSQLLLHQHQKHKTLLFLLQELTFGFWLKSPSFKFLLFTLKKMIEYSPQSFVKVLENPTLVSLLIESSDSEIRMHMAGFLSKIIADIVESENLTLTEESTVEENVVILRFLDHLFELLPTTVSKCWTKFNEYF